MSRIFCAFALSCILAVPCGAQQAAIRPELLIQLSVAPAKAPEPALKYQLLPELREMKPGNPVQAYLKCYLEQYRFVFDSEEFDRRKTLLAMPLEEPPVSAAPELGAFALAQVDAAARLDNPDWQFLLKLRADGFGAQIPDVQAMRVLGRALAVRFRSEIAEGRINDALRTAKTMFAMSRHMADHPIFISNLVGIAIASMAIEPLEALLQQPGCPNLYWALTNLPDPLVPINKGLQGERLSLWGFSHDLDSTAPMSAEQIQKFINNVGKLLGDNLPANGAGGVRGYLAARTSVPEKMVAARKRLVESGLPEALVKSLPPDQVVLLDEERELHSRFDEIAKIMLFPAWQFEALLEKPSPAKRDQAVFADALLPSQANMRRALARLEQRIALLRVVEALRMHAALHDGAFPAKLSDNSVPLPSDPITNKPFRYEANGKQAHLRGTPPKGMESNKYFNVHYELTLKN
jgi:hypothetical protein